MQLKSNHLHHPRTKTSIHQWQPLSYVLNQFCYSWWKGELELYNSVSVFCLYGPKILHFCNILYCLSSSRSGGDLLRISKGVVVNLFSFGKWPPLNTMQPTRTLHCRSTNCKRRTTHIRKLHQWLPPTTSRFDWFLLKRSKFLRKILHGKQ